MRITDEISSILLQLNERCYPFKKYELVIEHDQLSVLGHGGSGIVLPARKRGNTESDYAIKVIGFGKNHVDSVSFHSIIGKQMELGIDNDAIVKIYDYVELRVYLSEDHQILSVENMTIWEKEPKSDNYIHLQFVLMERLDQLVKADASRGIALTNPKLRDYSEKEVLRLAVDIGNTLERMHQQKVIHRDIKLENIFSKQTKEGGVYKLGDFGVAVLSVDGMSNTMAYTEGYSAPEVVRSFEEQYDCTSDIYSFGMTLYLLMNDLQFPGSNKYRVNMNQYTEDFVIPPPAHGSRELKKIVLKMISYHPQDRFKSMEEVVFILEQLLAVSPDEKLLSYRKGQKETSFAVGLAATVIASVLCGISCLPSEASLYNVWLIIAAVFCMLKGILVYKKISTGTLLCSIAIFVCGIVYIVQTGLVWWKLILLLIPAVLFERMALYYGIFFFLTSATSLVMKSLSYEAMTQYRYIYILASSILFIMAVYQEIMISYDKKFQKRMLGGDIFWLAVILIYLLMVILGINNTAGSLHAHSWLAGIIGYENTGQLAHFGILEIGCGGLIFSIIWLVRERIMLHYVRKSLHG